MAIKPRPQQFLVNWGNPLTAGLYLAFPFAEVGGTTSVTQGFMELVHKTPAQTTGTIGFKYAADGKTAYFNGSTTAFTYSHTSIQNSTNGPKGGISILTWITPDATQLGFATPLGISSSFHLEQSSVANSNKYQFFLTHGGVDKSYALIQLTAGVENFYAITYDAVSFNGNTYLNGLLQDTTSNSGGTKTIDTTTNDFLIGNRSGFSRQWAGMNSLTLVYNRALRGSEIFDIAQDPYQIFRTVKPNQAKSPSTVFTSSQAGALSFVGAQAKTTKATKSGALSFVGNQSKRISYLVSASLSFVGSIAKRLVLSVNTFAASLSFVGNISKRTGIPLSASLSFSGAYSKLISAKKSAVLQFSGATTKFTTYPLVAASVSFIGNMSKRTGYPLSASLSFVGNFLQGTLITYILAATMSFSGSLNKRTSRSLSASVSFIGSIAKRVGHVLSAAMVSFSTLLTTLKSSGPVVYHQLLTASLSFSGSLSTILEQVISKIISIALVVPSSLALALQLPPKLAISLENTKLAITLAKVNTISLALAVPENVSMSFTANVIKINLQIPEVLSFTLSVN